MTLLLKANVSIRNPAVDTLSCHTQRLGWLSLLQVENVRMLDRYNIRKPCLGNLFLTTTHLMFFDSENKKETWVSVKCAFHQRAIRSVNGETNFLYLFVCLDITQPHR